MLDYIIPRARDRNQHYIQTNNEDDRWNACGPTVDAMGFDIVGRDMSVFPEDYQPEDSIMSVYKCRFNLKKFREVCDHDFNIYPPQTVAQTGPVMGEIVYGRKVIDFSYGVTYQRIREAVVKDHPVKICGEFPVGDHYVLVVGFDDRGEKLIFNDPYPPQWPDGNGFLREMEASFFYEKVIPRFNLMLEFLT